MNRKLQFIISLFITVTGFSQDIGVSAINAPSTGCNLGINTVSVDITNYGATQAIITFNLRYQLDGNSVVTQSQLLTNFNSNSTQTVTFTIPLNLSGNYGTHTLRAYTDLTADTDRSNDTTSKVIVNYQPSNGGTLSADDSVCQGSNRDTLFLTNNIGAVQRWERNEGSGYVPVVNTDSFFVYTNVSTTTTYRVLVKNGDCSSSYSNEVTIAVYPAANAGVLQKDNQVCTGGNGDTLRLENYDGTIVKWQKNTGSMWVDVANTTDTLTYSSPTSTTLYRVIVSKGNCPNDTSNVVTVSVVSASKGGNIVPKNSMGCENENSGVLKLSNKQGNVKQWEISDDKGLTWVPVVNTTDSQRYNNLASTRWYRVLVEANGCASKYSDSAEVQILPKPVGGEVLKDKSICGGTNLDTLLLVNHVGSVLKWQSNTGSGWTSIANTSDTLIVSSIFQTTSYRAIVGNGVCSNDTSETATLTIISNTYGGKIQKDDSVCTGTNAGTLVLQGHIGDIRWWEISTDNGVNWTLLANEDTTQGYLNLTKTTWYRVLVDGTNCPKDYSDTAVLTAYIPPLQITASDTTSFCFGGEVDLEATLGYTSYSWRSGETTPKITVTTDNTYKVTITDKRGCINSDSIKVTVFDLPIANAGDDATISLGATIQLKGSGGEYYSWTPSEHLSDSLAENPFASPLTTTTYKLVVTDKNNCKGEDEVVITVNKDYNFNGKNLITPNGDGVNDAWSVDNILPYKECTVTIINRFGDIVFQKTGYDNGWDGTDGDKVVSDGTYYFIITCEGTSEVFKGNITLLTK